MPVLSTAKPKTKIFYGWWIVAVASAIHFVSGGLYATGLAVYFLPITRDLGLSRAALSLSFTLRSLESGIDGPIVGYLVDRLGPRVMVRAGAVMAGAGFILLGLTQDYIWFLLVFLGLLAPGFSSSVNHSLMALVNQWFQRRRAFAITLGYVGTELGGALITPLIALLVFNHGWRTAAILSGILVPLVYIPLSFFIHNTPESMGLRRDGAGPEEEPNLNAATAVHPHPHPNPLPPGRGEKDVDDFGVKEAMKTPAFWHLAIAMGFRLFSKSGLHVHLVPLMVWRGLDEPTSAILVGLFAFTQVPIRLGAAWVADRWSMTRIPAFACLVGVSAIAALLFGPQGNIWTSIAFVLLFALAESGNLVSWALIGDFYGRANFATLRGALSFVHSPMSLPAPVFLGWVFDQTESYTLALIPIAACYAIACALYLFLKRPRRAVVA